MNQSKWYPPSKYILKPLYWKLRRYFGNKRKAFTALLAISGLMHVLFFWLVGVVLGANTTMFIAFIVIVFTVLTVSSWTLGKHCETE